MNSGSSGIVPEDTVTTGTSGIGGAGVEAASCLQPGNPVRPRTSSTPSRPNVSLCARFCAVLVDIRRPSIIIRLLPTFTVLSHMHNLIDDTACQTSRSDEPGSLLVDLLQQILSI